jgi:hypothetical protein
VTRIVEMATEAGAAYVSGIALHLRGEVRGLWFEWLRANRPELVPRYEQLYRRGAYMPADERRKLAGLVQGPDLDPDVRWRGREEVAQMPRGEDPGGGTAPGPIESRAQPKDQNQCAQETLF